MMKSTVGRLYVAAIAVLVFFLFWATVSAHPWASAAKVDPRVADLQTREHNVRVEVAKAKAAVNHRWALYNKKLKHRKVAIARAEKKRAAAFARARAIAYSRRRVVYRTVVAGSGGGRSYAAVAVAAAAATPVVVAAIPVVVAAARPAAAAVLLRLQSSASEVAHRCRRAAHRDPAAFPRDEHRRRDPDRRSAESRCGAPV